MSDCRWPTKKLVMASNALAKVRRRAKQLQKNGMPYQKALKQAGAEVRAGKRVSGASRKKAAPKRKRISGTKTSSSIGTISHHIGQAKSIIKEQLGRKLLQKDMATTKTAKKKIGKDVAALKKKLRALS